MSYEQNNPVWKKLQSDYLNARELLSKLSFAEITPRAKKRQKQANEIFDDLLRACEPFVKQQALYWATEYKVPLFYKSRDPNSYQLDAIECEIYERVWKSVKKFAMEDQGEESNLPGYLWKGLKDSIGPFIFNDSLTKARGKSFRIRGAFNTGATKPPAIIQDEYSCGGLYGDDKPRNIYDNGLAESAFRDWFNGDQSKDATWRENARKRIRALFILGCELDEEKDIATAIMDQLDDYADVLDKPFEKPKYTKGYSFRKIAADLGYSEDKVARLAKQLFEKCGEKFSSARPIRAWGVKRDGEPYFKRWQTLKTGELWDAVNGAELASPLDELFKTPAESVASNTLVI